MDNFHIDVTCSGKENLKMALSLAFGRHKKVTGYSVEDGLLIFYWADSDKATKLPFEMDLSQATEFAFGWLEQANYGEEPDHDGDNGKGWRVFNEHWGHVKSRWQAFVAIQPEWAEYGK